MRRLTLLMALLGAACGSTDLDPPPFEDIDQVTDTDTDTDEAGGDGDAAPGDTSDDDGDGDSGPTDEEPTLPIDGFGQISDDCPSVMADMLTSPDPAFVRLAIDFGADAFDDATDVGLLTNGGQTVYGAGFGSSRLSEVFAFEALNRCDVATLVKTDDQIAYANDDGEKTDFSVSIGTTKLGVSVVRAFSFPLGDPYEVSDATPVIRSKLEDILLSSANVAPADAWTKQVLVVITWDSDAADSAAAAWNAFDAATRADTIVYVVVTNGDDSPIYD